MDLRRDEWIIIFSRRHEQSAMTVIRDFKKACSMLEIRVEDPIMIELQYEGDAAELEQKLLDHMQRSPDAAFRHPSIAVCILDRENNYPVVKEVCGMYQIPS